MPDYFDILNEIQSILREEMLEKIGEIIKKIDYIYNREKERERKQLGN